MWKTDESNITKLNNNKFKITKQKLMFKKKKNPKQILLRHEIRKTNLIYCKISR